MKRLIRFDLIKEYMEENGLSKTAFCQRCKISTTVFDRIERNEKNFRVYSILKIADTIGVRLSEIIEKVKWEDLQTKKE